MSKLIQQAVKLHQEGQLSEAERMYRSILWAAPRDFDALHLLGVLKLQQDDPNEAVRLIGAALEVDRKSVSAHLNYGAALAALKRHEEALASYDKALAITPRNANILSNRGDTLCDLGRPAEALASYEKAIAYDARCLSALVNRGILLRDLGRSTEALASYDKALAIDPKHAEAWSNRGTALHDLDRITDALKSYERALALRPDYIDALFNRGNALLALKQPAEAIKSYARALVLNPKHADAYNNRGNAFSALKRYEEALASYDQALAIKSDHIDALVNHAAAHRKLENFDQAIAEYEKLVATKPDLSSLLNELAECYVATCRWSEFDKLSEQVVAAAIEGRSMVDPFMLLGFDCTAAQHRACAENSLRLKKVASVKREWDRANFSTDRIRIAYLSADFHRHVTAHVMAELFELHDRERFEVIGISFGPDDGSQIRSRLVKSFDRFFDVSSQLDTQVAKVIRDLNVHVAIDLKGHTTDARIGILADRAAPVQASYMGFPATSGADFLDYIIADKIVLPFDQQPFYTEKIVHLPDSYYANDSKRQIASRIPSRTEAGLPEDAFVFVCFNNNWKINSRIFDIWMRLLKAVDGSALWLFKSNDSAVTNLRKEAQALGVDPDRLVFAPPLDLRDHLARLKLGDLFLDTLPYNAHTTTTDALWMGVPVLTCKGDVFVSRVAASLLEAIGLPELITTNLGDYEALALKLATEKPLLHSIRLKLLQNRTTCHLFDTDRFRRHIESAYTTMWETWQRGESPRSFSVQSD